jgi:hypothetical protein
MPLVPVPGQRVAGACMCMHHNHLAPVRYSHPATLLLWGTTTAGLGLARWSHRKNLMRSGAHTEKPDSRRKQ